MESPLNKEPELRRNGHIPSLLSDLWLAIRDWFRELLDLREGMDREGAIVAIKAGKLMRGANAWMLMCSIMIASLGLDLNSPAVIIGAMLISPLMSPILGIGLGVATNDREALMIALRHFGISIIIALVTSTLYFFITPLGQLTNEIQARTAPTFLDGLIAIFGGLAGIISMTRKDQTNAIPGVAIATALMPPLCVTGFGIVYGFEYGEWAIMLKSFYLFFLNSFFIALTSFFIIRLLNFPYREHPTEKDARRARLYITVFSLLLIIPSALILRDVMLDLRYKQSVKSFVDQYFKKTCLEYKIFTLNPDTNLLVMQLLDQDLPDSLSLANYNEILEDSFHVTRTYLRPIPDYDIQLQQLDRMQFEINTLGNVAKQINELQTLQHEQTKRNAELRRQLAEFEMDSLSLNRFTRQVKAAFPSLDQLAFGRVQTTNFRSTRDDLPLFVVHWNGQINGQSRGREAAKLDSFLRATFTLDTLKLVNEY